MSDMIMSQKTKPNLNILHVTIGFYPADTWGGPVKIVHQNATEMIRRGHSVTVYCSNLLNKNEKIRPQEGTFVEDIDGIRVVYFNTWNLKQWPGTLGPMWWPDLKSRLRRDLPTYDIVHINGFRNLIPLAVARASQSQASVRYVIQPHGAIPIIVNSGTAKQMFDKVLDVKPLQTADAIIAGQPSERAQAVAFGIDNERIVEIPNGLIPPAANTLPERGSFRAQYGLPSDAPMILFLGRLNRKKGVDMLIEAYAKMVNKTPALVIAGPDDGQMDEVKALVQKHQLGDRVLFTGLLQGNDIWSAYRDADLFVLPCRTDTFPMAIIESCAMGTPILTTDNCEIAHIVRGAAGETTPFDADEFANKMDALMDDPERLKKYSVSAQRMIQNEFSMQAVGDQLESLYLDLRDGPVRHAA
ncbi:glycosyltransferase [Candidatus Kaiserbacteria bacterium]|nr:glycosyltransferase [Candidatus Kaiserbacteria bacterium]